MTQFQRGKALAVLFFFITGVLFGYLGFSSSNPSVVVISLYFAFASAIGALIMMATVEG